MAAEEKEPGVTITYQGKICGPIFDYARSVGLEPGFGSVSMSTDDFKDFKIQESLPGLDYLGASKTQQKTGFQSAGQLVFQEVLENGVTHKVVWDQILVTERGVEVAYADDDPTREAVRVELTDIRYLWRTRGLLSSLINIPTQGKPAKASGGATQSGGGGTSSQEEQLSSALNALGAAAGAGTPASGLIQGAAGAAAATKFGATGGGDFTPGSMNEGKPWTVETVLAKKIFPELPGTPRLRVQSPRPAFLDKIVGPKQWDCILPKDALAQVLDEFQLDLALNLRSVSFQNRECASVTVWAKNEGELQLEPDRGDAATQKFTTFDTTDASCDPRIAESRKATPFRHVPACVVVIGAPRIKADRRKLEPVGFNRKGEIVPLEQALQEIGLSLDFAQIFAILTHEQRSTHLGVSQEGVREFERWAFKCFQLPGGVERNSDRLPILDSRAAVNSSGQFLPLRVFSENFTVARPLDLRDLFALQPILNKSVKKLLEIEEINKRELDAGSPEESKALKDRKAALEIEVKKLAELEQKIRTQPPKASPSAGINAALDALNLAASGATPASGQITAAQEALAAALKKLLRIEHYIVTVNIPFGEQSSGYKVDLERGLVTFESVQGHMFKDGVPFEQGAYLKAGARVELEFAYVNKPSRDEQLTPDFRYTLTVSREDGKAVVRKVRPDGAVPLKVHCPSLQEVVDVDGKSNKAELDVVAEKIAKDRLLVPQSVAGGVVEFAHPTPILNTGNVLSVAWHYGTDERPAVTAHVGTFDRFAPTPGIHFTRAFGGNGGLADIDGGVMRGSTYLPGGV